MTTHRLLSINDTDAIRITPPGIHSGMDITLQNVSASGYIYVGGEGVSEEDYGHRILPNNAISFELPSKNSLFVIASDSDVKLAIIEIGLESQD